MVEKRASHFKQFEEPIDNVLVFKVRVGRWLYDNKEVLDNDKQLIEFKKTMERYINDVEFNTLDECDRIIQEANKIRPLFYKNLELVNKKKRRERFKVNLVTVLICLLMLVMGFLILVMFSSL